MSDLATNIDTFFDHYAKSHTRLLTPHDPEWPSPCEIGEPFTDEQGKQLIEWQPVKRHPSAADFDGLERALELEIHPDVKTHYARYWSANLDAAAPDGYVNLLYLWNQQDVDRLTENLIGHAVACRHNRTPFSVFFACTEPDSDLYLTINNQTGAVMVEQPGRKPLRTVCDSLAEFMTLLVPSSPP